MKRSATKLLIVSAIATALLSIVDKPTAADSSHVRNSSVIAAFYLRSDTVTLHEPIYVQLSIRNDLANPVQLDLGRDRAANVVFRIANPRQHESHLAELSRGGFGGSGKVQLDPGTTFQETIILNEWHQFGVPGTYRIEPEIVSRSLFPGRMPLGIVTQPTTMILGINPRDPERLKSICEELASKTLAAQDMTKQEQYVRPLSYIEDLVAVPSLARVAAQALPSTRERAISGLARIAASVGSEKVMDALGPYRLTLEEPILEKVRQLKRGVVVAD